MATLLFLQSRGRVTAEQVADELEVSTRTARRDLEALSIAGIPVYSQPGRGGGWSLVGGARTDLSGLTAAEARTLFLVAGPSSAVTPQAKAALRKLVQALPETFRAEAEKAAAAIVLDPARWGGTAPPTPPHLETLQQAVVQGVQVRLGYSDREQAVTERTVHPLGLVAKGSVWYLVADTDAGMRTFRVWRVRSVDLTDDPVVRPPDFDLARAWEAVVAEIDSRRGSWRVRALADPGILRWMRGHFGTRLVIGDIIDDGRVAIELGFSPGTSSVAMELAGYSGGLEVLEPAEVRRDLAAIGSKLIERYADAAVGYSESTMALEWEETVVDATDPIELGRWWARALGWVVVSEDDGESEIRPGPERLPGLLFVPVGESKTTKNRLHLDFRPDDQATEVDRLLGLGARPADVGQGEESWVVLADPEGNEFCVLSAKPESG